MSLFKIPLILIAWWANIKGITAPRPPQPGRQRPDMGLHLRLEGKMTVLGFPFLFKLAMTLLMLADVLFAYADSHRSSALGQGILRGLCGDRAEHSHAYISLVFLIGVVMSVVAGILRVVCYRTLGQLFVFEMSIHHEHRLVTNGPYGMVRHPSYTALVLLQVGAMLTTFAPGSWWAEALSAKAPVRIALDVFWTVYTVYKILVCSRVSTEDAMLRKNFGKEWEEYADRVRYWFVPGVL